MQIKQATNSIKIKMHMITIGTQSTPALNTEKIIKRLSRTKVISFNSYVLVVVT